MGTHAPNPMQFGNSITKTGFGPLDKQKLNVPCSAIRGETSVNKSKLDLDLARYSQICSPADQVNSKMHVHCRRLPLG